MILQHNNYVLELIPQTQADFQLIKYIQAYQKDIKINKFYAPITKHLLDSIKHIGWPPSLIDLYYSYVLFYNINQINPTLQKDNLLRPYQSLCLNWARGTLSTYNFISLFWAPRTGKTLMATTIAAEYNQVVVSCLAGQDKNWEHHFKTYTNKKVFNVCGLSLEQRIKMYKEFYNSYDSVLICSMNTLFKDSETKNFNPKIYMFDMLILDEVHLIKNPQTKLWKNARDLRKGFNKCIGLTGTPVSRGANDLLGTLAVLSNGMFSKTLLSNYFFQQEYTFFSKYGTAGDLKISKKLEWLDFINIFCNQVHKEQALYWETRPNYSVINLNATEQQLKMYNRLVEHFELETNEGVKQVQEVIAQMSYLRQISTAPEIIKENTPNIKRQWLLEYFNNNPNKKVIVFSTHTAFLKLLYKDLNRNDVCLITGETKNKTETATEFQNGKYSIALCNIQAGSKGITLDTADTIIFLDKDYRPDENLQAAERFSATTADKVKDNKEIINLVINLPNNEYNIDLLIEDILNHKITQTDIINKFKENFAASMKNNI